MDEEVSSTPVPASSSGAAAKGRWHILIIEDDEKVAQVIQAALQLEDQTPWDTSIALSGEEALKLIAAQRVDLVLLDVRLPGISGAEVYRRLRAASATQRLPVIFLSGGTTFDLSLAGIQEGILLRKPFNIAELLAMVEATLPTAHDEPGAAAGQ